MFGELYKKKKNRKSNAEKKVKFITELDEILDEVHAQNIIKFIKLRINKTSSRISNEAILCQYQCYINNNRRCMDGSKKTVISFLLFLFPDTGSYIRYWT